MWSYNRQFAARSRVDFLAGRTKLGTREHLQRIPKRLPILLIAGARDPVGEKTGAACATCSPRTGRRAWSASA